MSACTADLAAHVTGVDKATLRKWVQRRKVRRYGRDAYDIDDIAREALRIARGKANLT